MQIFDSFVSLGMTYLELAKKRLQRMQETARHIKIPAKAELDKISLSSPPVKHSKKNLDCRF